METQNSAWIDLLNPSDVQFFKAIIANLPEYKYLITTRDRAETNSLAGAFGLKYKEIGTDYNTPLKKSLNTVYRTLQILSSNLRFDFSLSFENAQSSLIAYIKRKKSIQYCDNDLKFVQSNFVQDLETKIKALSSYVVVPRACHDLFSKYVDDDRLITYNGYKEDVYLADFTPDPLFMESMPFEDFVVLRPEALGSFYVNGNKSIVPDLLKLFRRENVNVVYLPREKEDRKYAEKSSACIPEKALNGLDLCYYARAVLTGSGTFAREAACMGRKSVSFFPGNNLLSVDRELVEAGKILHSRDPDEIIDYVLAGNGKKPAVERCLKVKKEVILKTQNLLRG
jgi:predicted glycosyltransferase